jgi:hypothetical protein
MARLPNGVDLYRAGFESGRGYDRDSLWVAVYESTVVGVWHSNPLRSIEHWVLGSATRSDPRLRRFHAWRQAVRELTPATDPEC